ncbi:MAG: NAD(P)-dependent alcohol dehydrogenase [Pseudomonadota bacterium]
MNMRAAICLGYGPPERVCIVRLPKPVPKPDEILIRVRASTVSSADHRIRALDMPPGIPLWLARAALGWRRPRRGVLGTELAGTVEAVGKAAKNFRVGERVFAFPGVELGGHADYRCLPATGRVVHMPDGMDFIEAAAMSFGCTAALDFLRRGQAMPGERILIRGASGAVGSAAVQLARHSGLRVAAVCSGDNAAWVEALGAERVIDYRKTDVFAHGERYDLVFDTVGGVPLAKWAPLLRPRGRLLLLANGLSDVLQVCGRSLPRDVSLVTGMAGERRQDLEHLAALFAAGAYRPAIDRVYPFARIREAHAYVDTGRKRGSVVVTFDHGGATTLDSSTTDLERHRATS